MKDAGEVGQALGHEFASAGAALAELGVVHDEDVAVAGPRIVRGGAIPAEDFYRCLFHRFMEQGAEGAPPISADADGDFD
jgi:hypothetical protein